MSTGGPHTPWLVGREVTVIGTFRPRPGVVATDLSGIDSASALEKPRRKCLVIDNESLLAQFAILDLPAATLEAGEMVRLLPEDRDAITAIGRAPDDGDPGPDEYILDGEAVAWLEPYYYVAGSHSIHDHVSETGEQRADYRRSAHLVARVGKDGRNTELSYRLNSLLRRRRTFAPYFLKSPDRDQGINIEGLAARGKRLFFGFRSPVLDGEALILSVRAAALFSPRGDLDARTIRVPLGNGVGIRDITTLPDGRFLILAGPKPDAYAGFTINLFDDRRETVWHLGTLAPTQRDKVEGLMLAAWKPGKRGEVKATVLTLSDHPENGHPMLYDLQLPAPR